MKKKITAATLIAILAIMVVAKFSITVNFSTAKGRFFVPPIPDDIAYLSQATKDANSLREQGWSLESLGHFTQHRHSPLLSTVATFSYI